MTSAHEYLNSEANESELRSRLDRDGITNYWLYEQADEQAKQERKIKEQDPNYGKSPQELKAELEFEGIVKRTVSVREVLEKGIPETQWRVKNIVPMRGIVMMGATAGSYKTYIAQHMGLSVTTENLFLEEFETTKSNVLYIDEENGVKLLAKRFRQLSDGHNIEQIPENLMLTVYEGIKLDRQEGAIILRKLIEKYDAGLIILDSMVRLMEGDEDRSTDVRAVFQSLKNIMEERNCAFLILHHTRKDDKGRMSALRGSGDFSAFADVVLMVSARAGIIKLAIEKNRHIDLSQTQPFKVEVVHPEGDMEKVMLRHTGGYEKNEEEGALDRCLEWIKQHLHQEGVEEFNSQDLHSQAKKHGYSKNTYYRAIGRMKEERIIYAGNKRGMWQVETRLLVVEQEDFIPNGNKSLGIKGMKVQHNGFHEGNNNNSQLLFPKESYSTGNGGNNSKPIKNSEDIKAYFYKNKSREISSQEIIDLVQAQNPQQAQRFTLTILEALAEKGDIFQVKPDRWKVLE